MEGGLGENTMIKPLDSRDPRYEKQVKLIEGVNYLGGLLNSIKRDQEQRITTFISLVASLLLGIFITRRMYNSLFIELSVIVLILILITIKENKDKKKLLINNNKLVNEGEKIGLNLKQKM